MKHYKKADNSVWAFEDDGSQDHLITNEMVLMTAEELSIFLTPPVVIPNSVTMAQARLALLDANLLDTVITNVSAMPRSAQIRWEFSSTVNRNSELVIALAGVLGLDSTALDNLFIAAATL